MAIQLFHTIFQQQLCRQNCPLNFSTYYFPHHFPQDFFLTPFTHFSHPTLPHIILTPFPKKYFYKNFPYSFSPCFSTNLYTQILQKKITPFVNQLFYLFCHTLWTFYQPFWTTFFYLIFFIAQSHGGQKSITKFNTQICQLVFH